MYTKRYCHYGISMIDGKLTALSINYSIKLMNNLENLLGISSQIIIIVSYVSTMSTIHQLYQLNTTVIAYRWA